MLCHSWQIEVADLGTLSKLLHTGPSMGRDEGRNGAFCPELQGGPGVSHSCIIKRSYSNRTVTLIQQLERYSVDYYV